MAAVNTPWVRQGRFITETGRRIQVDSPAWFAWLQTATHFYYSPDYPIYGFTARKEKRRHTYYWYGYLKTARKLHNIHLGKAEHLTKARLDQAYERLRQKSRPPRVSG
jgi:hypothetical protein